MKTITLWEPWATFIAHGHKCYETRSWQPPQSLIGRVIGIHASKRWQRDQKHILDRLIREHIELGDYAVYGWPFGCIVAACRLVAVHHTMVVRDSLSPLERALGDYSDGRFAWELEIVRLPDKPIPAQGMQGIWDWMGES